MLSAWKPRGNTKDFQVMKWWGRPLAGVCYRFGGDHFIRRGPEQQKPGAGPWQSLFGEQRDQDDLQSGVDQCSVLGSISQFFHSLFLLCFIKFSMTYGILSYCTTILCIIICIQDVISCIITTYLWNNGLYGKLCNSLFTDQVWNDLLSQGRQIRRFKDGQRNFVWLWAED